MQGIEELRVEFHVAPELATLRGVEEACTGRLLVVEGTDLLGGQNCEALPQNHDLILLGVQLVECVKHDPQWDLQLSLELRRSRRSPDVGILH